MKTRSQVLHYSAVALVLVQVGYGLGWAWHDISARLGFWSNPDLADAFIRSLTMTQEALFFSHVGMNIVTLGLVLMRRWWALPAFILSFALDRFEWVIMSGNDVFQLLVDTDLWALFSFTLQGLIITILMVMVFSGELKGSPWRDAEAER